MMKSRVALVPVAVLGLLLGGCGGGGNSGALPSAASPVQPNAEKGIVKFSVAVPPKSATKKPAYVSPATQSITVSLLPSGSIYALTASFGLTPTSTGCTSTVASTLCVLEITAPAGSYTASISTFDGPVVNGAATGNELSAAQGVAITAVANQTVTVPLTLNGIPAQIQPTYLGNGKFMVAALDTDGNYIVGAGAPTFTVAKSGGVAAVSITQPTTASPNAFSIAATTTLGSETLTITAAYASGQNTCTLPGAVCATSFTASTNQYLFVGNEESGAGGVLGFTVPLTSSSQTPLSFSQYYPEAGGIAVDGNGNLFFASYYDEDYPVYEVAAPYTGSEISLFSQYANSLAFDSNNNLFVSSEENGSVYEYAAPYTGSPIKTFSVTEPWMMAVDANNDLFVSSDDDTEYVTEFPYANGSYGSAVQIATNDDSNSVWLDKSGDLWVGTADSIQEFKPPFSNASTAALTITGAYPYEYCPGVFDSSGDLFVQYWSSTGYVYEYKASTISANQGGGTISSPDVSLAAGEYPCTAGVDTANNLYVLTYSGLGMSEGGLAQFSTSSFSSASSPAYTESSGFYYPYYGGAVMTKAGQLTVTL